MVPEIENFGEFAERAWTRHLVELRGEIKTLTSAKKKIAGLRYAEHQRLLNIELEAHIALLSDNAEEWLKVSLIAIKDKYVENLVLHH
ncbi:MAG: hypothetical protein QM764_20550 [Chitinophagaceae bacterium]